MILPFEFIRQIFELDIEQVGSVQGRQVAQIRGERLAFVSLGQRPGTAPPDDPVGDSLIQPLEAFMCDKQTGYIAGKRFQMLSSDAQKTYITVRGIYVVGTRPRFGLRRWNDGWSQRGGDRTANLRG
ncbi:MAG: hypothetical protein P8K08_22755 [Fuerstiella sp.]|nr:hypothetical protein [Fuerstiella sp.]